MQEIAAALVQALAPMGTAALPWVAVICLTGAVVYLYHQNLKQQQIVVDLLREGAKADKDMALAYASLVSQVQIATALRGRR